MKRHQLSRRTLLRGAGVGIALPVLDAMLNDRGLVWGAGAHPTRLFVWSFGNGTRMKLWNPSVGDADLAPSMLPPALAPLNASTGKAGLLGDVTLVTGLDHKQTVLAGAHDGVFIASGGPNVKSNLSAFPLPGGPSIDQVAANQLAPTTKLKSLVVSNDKDEIINWCILSWTDKGQPIQPYRSTTVLFDKLFGGGATGGAAGPSPDVLAARALNKSILDFVREDAKKLAATLGSVDRARIDEHLTAIFEIEKQLETPGAGAAGCDAKGMDLADGGDFVKRGRILMSLYVMALKCDLTRYGTFNYQNSDGMQRWPGIGMADHSASHTGSDDIVLEITKRKVEEFAFMLRLMKSIPEGDGTLLDHSVVLCSSEIGQGNSHSTRDLPVLLAGKGGGLKPGRHLSRKGANYNDMLCSLLNYTGAGTAKFGTGGSGPLAGL